jgi:hypothetical protein
MDSPIEQARQALRKAAKNVTTAAQAPGQEARSVIPRVRATLIHLRDLVRLIRGNAHLRRAAEDLERDHQEQLRRWLTARSAVLTRLRGLIEELARLSPESLLPVPESAPPHLRCFALRRSGAN